MNIKKPTMRVLLIQYSLSGDTNKATKEFLRGFQEEHDDNGHIGGTTSLEICQQQIEIIPTFPFPWKFWKFFDIMPETVWSNSPYRRQPNSYYTVADPFIDNNDSFDLIVLGWQTWYLCPSLPIQLALENKKYQKLLSTKSKHGHIVLIGTHRNMWHHASKVLCQSLLPYKIVGQINFVQSSAFLTSVVQTLRRQLLGVEGGIGSTTAKDDAYHEGKQFAKHYYENYYNNKQEGKKEEQEEKSAASPSSSSDSGSVVVYHGGKPFNSILSFCEEVWFPLKQSAGKIMGRFAPGSLGRKIVATLYIPVLLSAIVGLAPPILVVGSFLKATMNGGNNNADDDNNNDSLKEEEKKKKKKK